MKGKLKIFLTLGVMLMLFFVMGISASAYQLYEPDGSSSTVYDFDSSECNRKIIITCRDTSGTLLKKVTYNTKHGEDDFICLRIYDYDITAFESDQGLWETCKLMYTSGGMFQYGEIDIDYYFRTALSADTINVNVTMRKMAGIDISEYHCKMIDPFKTYPTYHQIYIRKIRAEVDQYIYLGGGYTGHSPKGSYKGTISGYFSYAWTDNVYINMNDNDADWDVIRSADYDDRVDYTKFNESEDGKLTYMANRKIEVYFYYNLNQYTVSFNANGGSGSLPSSQTQYYSFDVTIGNEVPYRSGYIFRGWGTYASDTTPNYYPGSTYTMGLSQTLYAVWEDYEFSIELNTKVVASNCINNGDVTSVATSGKKYAGGIVGWLVSGGVITKCGNNGTIKADGYAAGISAHSNNKVVQISYSYNTGDIISGYYAAGISACFANSASSVIGCWNSGKIIKGDTLLDGIKGVRCAQIAIGNIGIYHDNFFLDSVVAPEMAAGATVGAMLLPYYLTNDNKTTDVDSLEEKSSSFKTEDLASGKLACDINTSLGKSVFFQRLNGDNKDTIPTSDSSRGIVFNNNGTYLSILIETQSEASARIEAENAGLRFTTDVNKDDYNALLSAGISEVSFGTVITLNNTIKGIEEFGDVFTVDKLQNGSYHNFSATLNTEGDTYYFRNSIVNIPADKYEEEIVAIGYIKIGDTVLYSGNYSVRSVKDVATDAYEDRAMTSGILGYSNAIAADSSVSIASKLSYSPYTEAQLAIIKVFVG